MKKTIIFACISILGFTACCENKKTNTLIYSEMENELKIVAEITLKPEAIKAMKPVFEKVIAGSQAEEGCIYYDLHKDVNDTTDTKYVMLEVWKDQAAIDFHNNTQHYKTFKQASSDYVEDLKVSILKVSK